MPDLTGSVRRARLLCDVKEPGYRGDRLVETSTGSMRDIRRTPPVPFSPRSRLWKDTSTRCFRIVRTAWAVVRLKVFPLDQRSLLGRMWKCGIPRTARYTVLDKYDIALDLLAKPPFERDQEPYQGASALIALRNALIHVEPEFYPVPNLRGDPIAQHVLPKLEKKLRGRFALNPLAHEQFGFFPDKCLSAGCAKWAVQVSASLVHTFVKRMGIVERFKDPVARLMSI